MKTLRMMVLSIVALGGTLVPGLVWAGSPPPALVTPAPHPARAQSLSAGETQSLAQREQKSKDLDKYEGGQVVIAISTVGAIVIVVLLLLILL